MVVSDDCLELIAWSFKNFRVMSLVFFEGFSTAGLAAIATNCRVFLVFFRSLQGRTETIVGLFSGGFEACYTTLPHSLASFERKQKQTDEESRNAHHIRRVILKDQNATVDAVVQSLLSDRFCSQIQLTAKLVDDLLQNFGDDWKSALGFFEWVSSRNGYEHTQFAQNRMVDLLGKMRQMGRMWDLVQKMHCRGFLVEYS
ncbi:pentatricopeptide repeat-containing protein At3g04130, mitochondrial-like [Zingiber officinale]|uniref:pentatricopeptide repeat-containing protein At3g04130, mitochondrial-like n=1 Tax=Zingiber officinale TaxID=94328 RepID=UPI001C4D23FE|nr:pentatricopeptide repeat-containing protein At3g04130, mitochondrial-like [Zingiber officinale]